MGETGLAHASNGMNTTRDLDRDAIRFEFFRRFGGLLSENLRNGMCEIESLSVGVEAKRFDLTNTLCALLK